MFAALSKHVVTRPLNQKINSVLMGGTRRLATIADDASPRSPITGPKAAPAHQQPATLSIRDGPIFSGYDFGSHRDVLREFPIEFDYFAVVVPLSWTSGQAKAP